ncbi:hypothetical protein HPT25_28095 [Bacillus sp. BRMEA1]|uniref:hypothetical protein n=1 Tax=Neobacillus endophyticus TaxID=2738405 RepID=UPI0015644BC5|nr:hypothetical protein [Neobacillus endophyticus]NRD81157.1 hypothetical protein [Neobacillus endophyticus]
METTLDNIDFQAESENAELAITILRAFIDCALENEPAAVVITKLRKFIESVELGEEFAEFFRDPAEEYFYNHYGNHKEAEQRYQEFLKFATKHGLCSY